jgi:glucosamine-6-phosphate deaminase
MNPIYSLSIEQLQKKSRISIRVAESEIDLYYLMALSMYMEIEQNISARKQTVMILPVGPVFQYRRFITFLDFRPLDLSNIHLFFMDEYLEPGTNHAISPESPLSFRGFISRELSEPLDGKYGFKTKHIYFPDPANPLDYDLVLNERGGCDLCQAGVGIVGHIAFNEPQPSDNISLQAFKSLPTLIVELTRETITINSNTALREAFEEVPEKAITIGMKSLLETHKLEIYMNRPWQAAVLRKALLLDPTSEFPVTCAIDHPKLSITVTPQVAEVPDLALK